MKLLAKIMIGLIITLMIYPHQSEAQFGKLKSAMGKSKSKSSSGGGGNAFASFNDETDEMGITGSYYGLSDGKSYGYRFVKEDEGKLVNQLFYFEKAGDDPQLKMDMKESYFRKAEVKLFYNWLSASASGYIELIEVDPGVLAQIKSDRSYNDGPVALDATRTVVDVYAKDKANFDTWDIETAQAKVDMLIGTLKADEFVKVKKNLEKFEVYSTYKGKIAFAKGTNYLRNQKSNQPTEKPANFITKAELGATVAFKPYFEQPLEVSHPGAWFNITYEMAGEITDREKLRKSSTVFAENIPQIDKDQEKFYFWYPKVTVNTSNNVADYAFLELLRKSQNQLTAGQVYDLKVTVWAFKDGANIDPVASSTIQLEYTKEENGTKKLLFDPIKGWVTVLENLLDE
ncbi:hypothetical protein SAMN04488029_1532 [Reichenbachiella faecimaris]|uniref:Uncharacterized protein n=1 Tax=Reichenbachiella faecimaris TaxID=692418 RepID=A0A1W2G9Y1_REIFA|nr:hypothetical protein [Reichenbachiella faecimaris]SMD33168.1 hypothetical protein SAMN04488029_1532 [Reichenbachiella faecimaris]